jgi:hypothetical protein
MEDAEEVKKKVSALPRSDPERIRAPEKLISRHLGSEGLSTDEAR